MTRAHPSASSVNPTSFRGEQSDVVSGWYVGGKLERKEIGIKCRQNKLNIIALLSVLGGPI